MGSLAQSQIKVENNKFEWKETEFTIIETKLKPDLTILSCFSFLNGKKENYIFELDKEMNVIRFYYEPQNKWFNIK